MTCQSEVSTFCPSFDVSPCMSLSLVSVTASGGHFDFWQLSNVNFPVRNVSVKRQNLTKSGHFNPKCSVRLLSKFGLSKRSFLPSNCQNCQIWQLSLSTVTCQTSKLTILSVKLDECCGKALNQLNDQCNCFRRPFWFLTVRKCQFFLSEMSVSFDSSQMSIFLSEMTASKAVKRQNVTKLGNFSPKCSVRVFS